MRKQLLLWLLCWGGIGAACAQTPPMVLISKLSKMHTFKADFVQTIQNNKRQTLRASRGTLRLSRPGRLRWETQYPVPQILSVDKYALSIYDPGLRQLTLRPLPQATTLPALLLMGDPHQVVNHFNVTQSGNTFFLMPKQPDDFILMVSIMFANNLPIQMQWRDRLNQTTRIDFKKAKLNPKITASAFLIKVPKDTDIIRHPENPRSREQK